MHTKVSILEACGTKLMGKNAPFTLNGFGRYLTALVVSCCCIEDGCMVRRCIDGHPRHGTEEDERSVGANGCIEFIGRNKFIEII